MRWTQFRTSWKFPTIVLCVYGFLYNMRPSEPFLTPYLVGPDVQLSTEDVTNKVLPVWTYSYLALLLPVFLLTDFLRYKAVIVLQGAALVATWCLLLWARGVPAMQAMEFCYGVVTATEVAYYSYIYSVVAAKHYQRVTGYCRSATLAGYTLASVLGQLLVSVAGTSYRSLNIISLASVSLAFLASFLLPSPERSMFFHKRAALAPTPSKADGDAGLTGDGDDGEAASPSVPSVAAAELRAGASVAATAASNAPYRPLSGGKVADSQKVASEEQVLVDERQCPRYGEALFEGTTHDAKAGSDSCDVVDLAGSSSSSSSSSSPPLPSGIDASFAGVITRLLKDFAKCYTDRSLLVWSIWWALATCGYNQVINYVQVLWAEMEPSNSTAVYNGGVEAVSTLVGAVSAFAVGFMPLDWALWGELALGVFSGLDAAALFLMAALDSVWVGYVGYVVFKGSYTFLITIATFQIAATLDMERYALVFGANTFVALVLQTVLTVVVVDSRGLGLDVVTQFFIYACYFTAIAALFVLKGLHTVVRRQLLRGSEPSKLEPGPSPSPPPSSSSSSSPVNDACPGSSRVIHSSQL
ncbi:thiamine transporter 2-like [Lethenteron reissneri]|uniref:thiamine transporter 2-like n=1 Tax=Lethenteron reissneri TaxID=7753 RepID=UPI002AB7B2FD|nr:thiamine transporter 2-like [Lethenteron reissneri]